MEDPSSSSSSSTSSPSSNITRNKPAAPADLSKVTVTTTGSSTATTTLSKNNLVDKLYQQYEKASTYLLDIYAYQFLPLNHDHRNSSSSCPSLSSATSTGELSDDCLIVDQSRGRSSRTKTNWQAAGKRRSEGAPSFGGTISCSSSTTSSTSAATLSDHDRVSLKDRFKSIVSMAPSPKSPTPSSASSTGRNEEQQHEQNNNNLNSNNHKKQPQKKKLIVSPVGQYIKQNVSSHFSSVNPFDNQSKPCKDGNHCKRLSCESHKKCCGSQSTSAGTSNNNKQCPVHSSSSSRAVVAPNNSGHHPNVTTRTYVRNPRSEVKVTKESSSAAKEMKKRSSSCPRGPLFPIATTLAHVKRTEFNKEKATILSPGSSSSSLATSSNVVSVRGRPQTTSHVTPTFVSKPPTTFTSNKAPSTGKALVSIGNKTPSPTSVLAASSRSKTPIRSSTTTPKISSITGKPIPVTEVKAVKSLIMPSVDSNHRRGADATDCGPSKVVSRSMALASKSSTEPNYKISTSTTNPGRQNSQYNIRLKLNLNLNNDSISNNKVSGSNKKSQQMVIESPSPDFSTSSSRNDRRLSIKDELDTETGAFKVKTTNINVAVRLRPFNRHESSSKSVVQLDRDRNCVTVNGTEFEFNKVLDSSDHFNPVDDQASVYGAVGKPLLDHALNGYNVCLFAYGQTGSGKTYSITGPEDDVAEFDTSGDAGIIPRFVHDLFLDVTPGSLITLTYIEIYNDQIYNLLQDPNSSSNIVYKVREHPVLGPYIPNLIPIIVDTSADLLSHVSMGNMRRAKAATASNEHSSRSHAIVTISVHQRSEESFCDGNCDDDDSQSSEGERIMSKINIVDLAGSERVAAVQSTGDRFKEGTCINKSLLTLGKVISELSAMNEYRGRSSKSHVPYRESTLTFLLKESLGGNSKTCMLATISPSASQMEETLSTLRYASKASRIVNRVRINEDPKNRKIRMLEIEVAKLRALLDIQRQLPAADCVLDCGRDEKKQKKDKNNNDDHKKNKRMDETPSTSTSPSNSSKSGTVTPTSESPSSVTSTPKKSNLKKAVSSMVDTSTTTSNVSTPTKTSTPVAAKRKGKDQSTVTEKKKEVDAETSTDEWMAEIVEDVGDFESNLIETIENIFEGKEEETLKSKKSSEKVSKDGESDKKKKKSSKKETSIKKVVDVKEPEVVTIDVSPEVKKSDAKKKDAKDDDSWSASPPPVEVVVADKKEESKDKKKKNEDGDKKVDKKKKEKKKSDKEKDDDSWSACPSPVEVVADQKKDQKKDAKKKVDNVDEKKDDSWSASPTASKKSTPEKEKKDKVDTFDSWDEPSKVEASPAKDDKKKAKDKIIVPVSAWGDSPPPPTTTKSGGDDGSADKKKKEKKDKKKMDKKSSTSMAEEDESVQSNGLNTAMIRDSTIELTEDEASRHVNFQDTQEIRYYQPSITETTQEISTNVDTTIDTTISSDSSTPTKKKDKKKAGKSSPSPTASTGDSMTELKATLDGRKEISPCRDGKGLDWVKIGDGKWSEDGRGWQGDLRMEQPLLANVTKDQSNNDDNWGDEPATGGDDDKKCDDQKDDDWNEGGDKNDADAGNNDQWDDWGANDGQQDKNGDDWNDDNNAGDNQDNANGDDWNDDQQQDNDNDWNESETVVKTEPVAADGGDDDW